MLLSRDLLLTSRTRNRDAKNKTRDQNFDDDSDDKLYNQKWLGHIQVLRHKNKIYRIIAEIAFLANFSESLRESF